MRSRRVGQRAVERRRAGGKLAVGRPSATFDELLIEREHVKARAREMCEIRAARWPLHPGTDFAHVVARSHGGTDDRYNALWLCRMHHRMMESPFTNRRLRVTRVSRYGYRGFEWEIVQAGDKAAYWRGEYTELAKGFIVAERWAG